MGAASRNWGKAPAGRARRGEGGEPGTQWFESTQLYQQNQLVSGKLPYLRNACVRNVSAFAMQVTAAWPSRVPKEGIHVKMSEKTKNDPAFTA